MRKYFKKLLKSSKGVAAGPVLALMAMAYWVFVEVCEKYLK